jgi:hypothetical protein
LSRQKKKNYKYSSTIAAREYFKWEFCTVLQTPIAGSVMSKSATFLYVLIAVLFLGVCDLQCSAQLVGAKDDSLPIRGEWQ